MFTDNVQILSKITLQHFGAFFLVSGLLLNSVRRLMGHEMCKEHEKFSGVQGQ